MPIENYEEVSIYPLDPEVQEELLLTQNECCFIWGPKDHWAVGVFMSYIWRHGRFWLTATSQRKRVAAIRRDDRVSVAVSSAGTHLGPARTATAKGRCILHDDAETASWVYPDIARAILGDEPSLVEMFTEMLDSERRLVFEVVPEKWITYDSTKLMSDSITAWVAQKQAEEAEQGG